MLQTKLASGEFSTITVERKKANDSEVAEVTVGAVLVASTE